MVAIVGGGISGLSAAYELHRRQIPFVLFEASSRLGGLVHTEQVDGFTIEAGADSMLVQKKAGIELCEELGLGSRLLTMQHPRAAYVLKHGRLHPLPSPSMLGVPATWGGLFRYSLLPASARLRMAIEPVVPRRRDGGDESVSAFFLRRFGRDAVDLLAQPLLGGIHAGDIASLSMRALFPRIADIESGGGSVLRWVRDTAARRDADGAFRSLAGGMSELVEAIRRTLPADSVRCDAPVRSILAGAGGGWDVMTDAGSSRSDAVILACPARVAATLLSDVDPAAADLCRKVRYVSTASVALAWPRKAIAHPLAGSGFVVARAANDLRITACTWVSSKWSSRAPAGRVLLRAYIGGAHDSAAVDLEDQALIDVAVRELSAILSIDGPPDVARVYRWRDAGAQHEVGHLARVRELERRLAALRGLFITGSGFRSIGIPDCIADGRAVAASAGSFVHAA